MNIDFEIRSVIERGKYLLKNYSNNSQFIFYAALETRYAIEIILNDWLNFTIEGSHSLTDYLQDLYGNNIPIGSLDVPPNPKVLNDKRKARKFYSPEKYQNKIKEIVPEFEKRIEFMAIIDSHYDKMKAPNFSQLNKYYGRVGRLLHYPKFELNIKEIYSDLISILDYLEKNIESSRCFLTFNKEGERMFNKFKNSELTDDEMNELKNNGHNYHSGGFHQLM